MKTLRLAALAALLGYGLAPLPAQANTKRTYAKVTQTNPGASTLQMSTVELLRFLVEGTTVGGGAATGPGWTLVEAYSDGVRCMPSDASDVDSLETESAGPVPSGTPGCAGMRGDGSGLSTGDWWVVESADSDTDGLTNHFQMMVEYDTTAVWKFWLLPLEDWQVGTATPAAAGTSTPIGAGTALVSFSSFSTAGTMSIVADESVLHVWRDDGAGNVDWMPLGALDGARVAGTPADDRPYIIADKPDVVGFSTASYRNRLSPVDDATVLTSGYPAVIGQISDDATHATGDDTHLLGVWTVLPAGVYFSDAAHQHFAGFLRYVYTCSKALGSSASGTLDSANFLWMSYGITTTAVCVDWDGITAYP